MALPEGQDFEDQLRAIIDLDMIPVFLKVFDQQQDQKLDDYLVGCHAIPRIGEVIEYGNTNVVVFGVRHSFGTAKLFPDTQIRHQAITIAAYEEPVDEG
jgi:hypothetical protein